MSDRGEKNPIRALHMVGDSRFGGIALIIAGLGRVAAEQGWTLDVLTTDPNVQEYVRRAGMGVVNLDVIRRPIRPWDLIGLIRLWRFLRRERYTIVHTHTSKAGFIGRLAAWFARVPVILHTAHGFAFHEGSSRGVVRFYSTLERLASNWCDRLITVSEFHRRWALELGICAPEKIIAIPNGAVAIKAAPDQSCWSDELLILSNARLAEDKGLEYLIEAAVYLWRRDLRFRIVIAGDGPMRAKLEQLATELNVARFVQFVGFRHDIDTWLRACDLVVFPSLREGLSIALLEAMSAGKPIVATSIGSVREIASEGEMAELVPPADPIALADAVYRLANNRVRQALLGKAAKELFESRYTEERMLNAYRDLYVERLRCAGVSARPAERRQAGASSVVRPAGAHDLTQIVSIHQKAFSDFFLTRLGPEFLRKYYELVLAYRSGIVLAREKDGALEGFVCGFLNPPEFYRLMWRNKRAFMLPALLAVLRNPSLTGKTLLGIHRVQSSAAQAQPVTCELSSIAVTPEMSGNGVGKSLVRAFLAHSWNMEAECVSLTTDAEDNDAANRLYHEAGFSVVRRFLQRKGRWMNEYMIQRPQAAPCEEGLL
jgi:glycosyltransferase involved in cell wall biosynthesis/ribosomal protein S18 acetylase RimI-like enzyme